MNPQLITQLVSLGLTLATKVIERRANRQVGEMSDEEIRATIADIEIQSVDDLIEQGRERARAKKEESI